MDPVIALSTIVLVSLFIIAAIGLVIIHRSDCVNALWPTIHTTGRRDDRRRTDRQRLESSDSSDDALDFEEDFEAA